jgi:hypothetical protein
MQNNVGERHECLNHKPTAKLRRRPRPRLKALDNQLSLAEVQRETVAMRSTAVASCRSCEKRGAADTTK